MTRWRRRHSHGTPSVGMLPHPPAVRPAPTTRDQVTLTDLTLHRLEDVRTAAQKLVTATGGAKKRPAAQLDELQTALDALAAAVTRLARASTDARRREADGSEGIDQLRGRRR